MNKADLKFTKVSVNLLPLEYINLQKKDRKFTLLKNLSIIILGMMLFLTSGTFALRLSQNFELEKSKSNLVLAEEKVNSLQEKEKQTIAIKQRLSLIEKLSGSDDLKRITLTMLVSIIPAEIEVSEITIDKNSNLSITASTSSLTALETLSNNLKDTEKTQNLISKADLDGISFGKDSLYRFALKIGVKK